MFGQSFCSYEQIEAKIGGVICLLCLSLLNSNGICWFSCINTGITLLKNMTDIKKVYFQKFNDELMNNSDMCSFMQSFYWIDYKF